MRDTTEPVVFMYSRDKDGIDFYAKIQCNNMIPVPDTELIKIDVNSEPDFALLEKKCDEWEANKK